MPEIARYRDVLRRRTGAEPDALLSAHYGAIGDRQFRRREAERRSVSSPQSGSPRDSASWRRCRPPSAGCPAPSRTSSSEVRWMRATPWSDGCCWPPIQATGCPRMCISRKRPPLPCRAKRCSTFRSPICWLGRRCRPTVPADALARRSTSWSRSRPLGARSGPSAGRTRLLR